MGAWWAEERRRDESRQGEGNGGFGKGCWEVVAFTPLAFAGYPDRRPWVWDSGGEGRGEWQIENEGETVWVMIDAGMGLDGSETTRRRRGKRLPRGCYILAS